MPLKVFRDLAGRVIRSSARKEILFILHGVEPMLLDSAWLQEARDYLDIEERIYGKALRMGMQSNILSLRESKIEAIKKRGSHSVPAWMVRISKDRCGH